MTDTVALLTLARDGDPDALDVLPGLHQGRLLTLIRLRRVRRMRLQLNDPLPEEDRRVIEDLKAGKQASLRFVFHATREAAREVHEFRYDEFWQGELDVTLPLRNN